MVYKYPTERISQISIGFVPEIDPNGQVEHKPLLWGEKHYKAEYQLLVANEQDQSESSAGTVPVSIVIAAVPVQYRIKDLYAFVYNLKEPEKLLESICYRELTKYAASAKIEVEDKADAKQSFIGMGRVEAGKILTERIQAAAREARLGVEIVFVGLEGIHPPVEVAADYQKVIAAFQKKQQSILEAKAERNKILGTLVGSVERAEALYDLATKYQEAEASGSQTEIETIGNQLDEAFEQAKGEIFKRLREAQNYAFQKEILAEATGLQFAGQLKAYNDAPQIYTHEQWLTMLEESLKNIRKYVVVAGPNDTQVTIFDFQDKLMPNLTDYLSGLEESSQP
jgi:membrane protease subunit HflK